MKIMEGHKGHLFSPWEVDSINFLVAFSYLSSVFYASSTMAGLVFWGLVCYNILYHYQKWFRIKPPVIIQYIVYGGQCAGSQFWFQ